MNISDTLKAAFANIDRLEAEKKANDSSTEQVTAQVSDEDVADIFAEEIATVEVDTVDGMNPDRWGPNGEDLFAKPEEASADTWNKACDKVVTDALAQDGVDLSADTWTKASTAAEPLVRNAIKVKGLDEKAVLVQLKRSMFGTSKRDDEESKMYGAGNVIKHLFEGRNNRMAEVKVAYADVYTYVNENTVPWATGVRMLNIDHYFDFTSGLRKRIEAADDAVADLEVNWAYEVQKDLDRLQAIADAKGKPNLVNPDDYPDASEIGGRFNIEVRYLPVPTTGDFRVAISDEDKATLQKQLTDAEENAARHVVEEMLNPMMAAAAKLATPIGKDGSIFRDSLIDNMVDVADRMARVNVSADPVISDKIAELRSLVGTYANNKEVLRNSQTVRAKAASQIEALMGTMQGLV